MGLLAHSTCSDGTSGVSLLVHAPLVFAACGALHTPALLLRSGVRSRGNVGRHLRLHPALGVTAVFQQTLEQQAAGLGAIEPHRGVAMGSFSRAAAGWEEGGYGAMVSVPAAHPGMLAALCPDAAPGQLKRLMLHLPNMSPIVVFARDSSAGRVLIDSAGRPVVHYSPCSSTRRHLLDVRAGAACARVLCSYSVALWCMRLWLQL